MYISILGRQPALGVAELERLYGAASVRWFSDQTATVDNATFDFERLGGSQKSGNVVTELPSTDWHKISQHIVTTYLRNWSSHDGKITLGISAYGFKNVTVRDIQKTGIILKQKLRQQGVSVRLVPNTEAILNTATSHHNKLGLSANKVELLIICGSSAKTIIAESVGAQNITALAARDQARPYTDAFIGMLPPKLARMMINLTNTASMSSNSSTIIPGEGSAFPAEARQERKLDQLTPSRPEKVIDSRRIAGKKTDSTPFILDPFCGTGVVLQEALLLGYNTYGTDLSEKMVDYSTKNLQWLDAKFHFQDNGFTVEQGDAMTHRWRPPITAVVCEGYLGQPFSAPPSPAKLTEVRGNCNHIISSFLRNLANQVTSGTPLCIAVPAWRDTKGNFTHLPFIKDLEKLGYTRHQFTRVRDHDLLYYRENQVVARELLVLIRR